MIQPYTELKAKEIKYPPKIKPLLGFSMADGLQIGLGDGSIMLLKSQSGLWAKTSSGN